MKRWTYCVAVMCSGSLLFGAFACGGTTETPPPITLDTVAPDTPADPDAQSTGDASSAETTDASRSNDVGTDSMLSDAGGSDSTHSHDMGPPPQCKSDADCDDGDGCTDDSCNLGTLVCIFKPNPALPGCGEAGNDPCTQSALPGTNDPSIESCVCAADSYCCEQAWDEICVNLASEECGAPCGCNAPDADLSCASDADCMMCNTSWDLCENPWVCQGGVCAQSGPVVCSSEGDTGCLKNACNPMTGACELGPDWQACQDGDVCTTDICDENTGVCSNEALEGCGSNHPCNPLGTPGSNDESVTACVCAEDDFCCDEFGGWYEFCVEIAKNSCGVACECDQIDPKELSCEVDADCAWCDDGDPCNGSWTCHDGTCAALPPVVCDASNDVGCYQNLCNPETLTCAMTANTSVWSDGDEGTADVCSSEDGSCSNPLQCGTNHPCQTADWPESNDKDVTACVCASDSYCCEVAWDGLCVMAASDLCGAVCSCDEPLADLACGSDADCDWCESNACESNWTCTEGLCTAGPGLVCDDSEDTACIKNTCVPESGGCEKLPSNQACADGDSCTVDLCDVAAGTCSNPTIEGCVGEPPFECKGPGVASVDGCTFVETYEGCCDPWGRVLWCEEFSDPAGDVKKGTVCIDCAGTAPFCGWNEFYYMCDTDGTAGPAEFPKACTNL